MSYVTQSGVRLHVLAIATTIALSSMVALSATAAERVNLSGLQASQTFDRFIVKYRDGSSQRNNPALLQSSLNKAAGVMPATKGRTLGLKFVRHMAVQADVIKSDRKLDRADAESLMRQIAADPNVEYVEVDKLNQALLTPNDTNFSQQYGFGTGAGGIFATQAWDITSGSGVVIAILDTGITNHSDLNANVIPGYDFVSDLTMAADGNGRDPDPSDPGDATGGGSSSWHGTHVTGTAAAVTNNAKGVAGTAFGAKVQMVRVLGKGGGSDSDIADAIVWASGGTVSGVPANPTPAKVISLSLGGSGACSSASQAAINGAVSRGTTLVIAAGNGNTNVSNSSPANCANVIAIGATDSNGARASFSNFGAGVDVAAPGVGILSTLNSGTTSPGTESYASYSGTSMSTPHVAGVVALIQAVANPDKTPAEVEALLKSTARAFPSTPSQPIGAGIVNAKAAVDAAGGGGGGGTTALNNGVPVSSISGALGSDKLFTLDVPTGATGLKFVTSGGTGDADLYVKFGSAPTTTVNDCKSEGGTTAETCNIPTAQVGKYYVLVHGFSAFSGMSLTGSYSTGGGGGTQTYTNTTDFPINDNATVDSPIAVTGRSGNAGSAVSVSVNIVHTYIGDLRVDLMAPDGSLYNIHNHTGGSADNIVKTVTLNLSSEVLNGTWKLRVNDNAAADTGFINSWSVTF